MSAALWVTEAAARFWEDAGGPEPFPRALHRPIAMALPLAVVLLPRLRVAAIDCWLREQGVPCGIAAADRPLRACLVARAGQGLLFVDGADREDERRFSLAHELAHFLRHYAGPRERAGSALGLEILQVLDGRRSPTHQERAHALLAGLQIGYHVHLMERRDSGASAAVSAAEREADALAFELLAPASDLELAAQRYPATDRRARIAESLEGHYGLPPAQAGQYAATLVPGPRQGSTLLRALRATP